MRRALALASLSLLVAAVPATAGPAPPLSHKGTWITDAQRRVVILHGVNMVYKRPPYHPRAIGFNAADARFLRRHGFNNVRLGVIYAAVEPLPGRYDTGYLRRIKATQRLLARNRIFSMIDFHQDQYNEQFEGEGWPDWAVYDDGFPTEPTPGFGPTYFVSPGLNQAFNNFWLNRDAPDGIGLQDHYAAAWRHVARRFRSQRYVMGYDLINEPWPGSQWPTCTHPEGCPSFERDFLAPMQAKAMRAIRRVDRRRLIWYEPVVTTQAGPEYWVPNPTEDPRAGMSFHVYCVAAVVDAYYSGLSDQSCDQVDVIAMANGVERAEANGDAMVLSEFGATDDPAVITRIVDLADTHALSWQWWHYCGCNDPTTAGPGDKQAIVRNPQRAPRGRNVIRDKLRLIERPYPQAVAGTPERFSFNRERRVFRLVYSTGRARANGEPGRPLPRRRLTEVYVPRIHYRGGYSVRVEGAEVVSGPHSRILKLRRHGGADRVSVRVKPERG